MIAAIYTRVSTPDQSTDSQLLELRQFCQRMNWDVNGFTDAGITGARARLPGLDAMLDAIRRRKIDVVVVSRFDRLGRAVVNLYELLREMTELGVRVIAVNQAIDTGTSQGRAMFGMLTVFAEFERDLTRERIQSGMAAARARGKKPGRPRREVNGGLAAQAAILRAQGHSYATIAKNLKVGVGSVYRAVNGAGKRKG